MSKIGFACQYMDAITKKNKFPLRSIQLTSFKELNVSQRDEKMKEVMIHNLLQTNLLINTVSFMPPERRMLRLGSEILPFYTIFPSFYEDSEIKNIIETEFNKIGNIARENNIRLSFHPGQYTVLNSVKENVWINAIRDIEYHTDMARMMGYEGDFHPYGFCINIHVGGKEGGLSNFRKNFDYLSEDAQDLLTVENDEYSFGVNDVLELSDLCPIVLDLHHHWVKENSYIDIRDYRVSKIINSWCGKRPKIHMSQPHEKIYSNKDELPYLTESITKGIARAHSDYMWNNKLNEYMLTFNNEFDIMIEAKMKNLAY